MEVQSKVTRTVQSSNVEAGLWRGDEDSSHAILMESKKGPLWIRSRDWVIYGNMYGWHRVAVIEEG